MLLIASAFACNILDAADQTDNLFMAMRAGRIAAAENFARSGNINLEAKDSCDWTPLLIASYFGYKEVVKVLLVRGANTEAQDKWGRTATELAVSKGHREIAQLIASWK